MRQPVLFATEKEGHGLGGGGSVSTLSSAAASSIAIDVVMDHAQFVDTLEDMMTIGIKAVLSEKR